MTAERGDLYSYSTDSDGPELIARGRPLTTDPQPVTTPEGFDWYMPSTLNDEEWTVWGRNPAIRNHCSFPHFYRDAKGPVLARRKPPEPWVPKVGDRARWKELGATVTVLTVCGPWYLVMVDNQDWPYVLQVKNLAPIGHDQ